MAQHCASVGLAKDSSPNQRSEGSYKIRSNCLKQARSSSQKIFTPAREGGVAFAHARPRGGENRNVAPLACRRCGGRRRWGDARSSRCRNLELGRPFPDFSNPARLTHLPGMVAKGEWQVFDVHGRYPRSRKEGQQTGWGTSIDLNLNRVAGKCISTRCRLHSHTRVHELHILHTEIKLPPLSPLLSNTATIL